MCFRLGREDRWESVLAVGFIDQIGEFLVVVAVVRIKLVNLAVLPSVRHRRSGRTIEERSRTIWPFEKDTEMPFRCFGEERWDSIVPTTSPWRVAPDELLTVWGRLPVS